MNPLYSEQKGALPPDVLNGIDYVKNLYGSLQDPTQILNDPKFMNDPRVKEVLNLCRGSTAEQVGRQLCAMLGIDPTSLLNEVQRKINLA